MRAGPKLMVFATAALSVCGTALADGAPRVVGTAADSGVGDERIICKKHLETGSLVRRIKKCFTKAEWDRIAEAEQIGVRKTQDALSARSMGN